LNINITVLSVTVNTVPTAKGSYQVADVAYKNNSFQGKIEGKKVMSFGATEGAFKTLVDGAVGVTFDVEYVQTQGKDGKTYNNWVKMTKATGAAQSAGDAVPAAMSQKGAMVGGSTRSTYETPEERAIKQVYIVRQSSLATAERLLSVGAKTPVKVEDVLAMAQKLEEYVFGKKSPGASGFEDFPDVPDEFIKPE
jgi:hypothetical protein